MYHQRAEKEKTKPDAYDWVHFSADLQRYGAVEKTEGDIIGINAVYLLMKGKYVNQLTELLEKPETPVAIKLCICNFFIIGRFSESSALVEKTLRQLTDKSLDEWLASQKSKNGDKEI